MRMSELTQAKVMSTVIPEGYNYSKKRYERKEDEYSILSSEDRRVDIKDIKPGEVRLGKTVVPDVVGTPTKMATIYEMLKFWPFFDQGLYNEIMDLIKYVEQIEVENILKS